MQEGYLKIIMGPMWSGKTSYIISEYNKCKAANISVLAINFKGDTRYEEKNEIKSHDGMSIPCIYSNSDVMSTAEYKKSKVILINEAQFFGNIVEMVKIALEKDNKTVFACGLDSDFERKPFGNWLDLICIADEVIKLNSICSCGKKAIFTHRTNSNQDKVDISLDYVPLCRKCYLLNVSGAK